MNQTRNMKLSESQGGGPPVGVKASFAILNPWYSLPPRVYAVSDLTSFSTLEDAPNITSPCYVSLDRSKLKLFFQCDEIIFVFVGDSMAQRYLVDPIRNFITYKTFINYNLIYPAEDPSEKGTYGETALVRFKVEHIQYLKTDKRLHYSKKDEYIEVTKDELIHYIQCNDWTLYNSIVFYLRGCNNIDYMLVEFYKSVEFIKKKFGNENKFIEALQVYGVKKKDYKNFGRICNDQSETPLDIGRHAPDLEVPVHLFNSREMRVGTRSWDVFESSSMFCRKVIDAYMSFLFAS
jgi:hypothetical protein